MGAQKGLQAWASLPISLGICFGHVHKSLFHACPVDGIKWVTFPLEEPPAGGLRQTHIQPVIKGHE